MCIGVVLFMVYFFGFVAFVFIYLFGFVWGFFALLVFGGFFLRPLQ